MAPEGLGTASAGERIAVPACWEECLCLSALRGHDCGRVRDRCGRVRDRCGRVRDHCGRVRDRCGRVRDHCGRDHCGRGRCGVEETGPCGWSAPVPAHVCVPCHVRDHGRGQDHDHVCPAHVHQNVYGHYPLPWCDHDCVLHHAHDRGRDHVHGRVL